MDWPCRCGTITHAKTAKDVKGVVKEVGKVASEAASEMPLPLLRDADAP